MFEKRCLYCAFTIRNISFKNLIGGDSILVDERLVQEALDAFIAGAWVGGVRRATQG